MKHIKKLTALLVASLACGLVALAGPKEDRPAGTPPADGSGPSANGGPGGGRFEVPGVGHLPKNVEIPDALKKALDEFNALRLKQTEIQKALAATLGTATAEEKAKIKEQLKANRDKFLEDTKQLRADIREQIKALRAALKDTPPVDGGDKGGKGHGRKDG